MYSWGMNYTYQNNRYEAKKKKKKKQLSVIDSPSLFLRGHIDEIGC